MVRAGQDDVPFLSENDEGKSCFPLRACFRPPLSPSLSAPRFTPPQQTPELNCHKKTLSDGARMLCCIRNRPENRFKKGLGYGILEESERLRNLNQTKRICQRNFCMNDTSTRGPNVAHTEAPPLQALQPAAIAASAPLFNLFALHHQAFARPSCSYARGNSYSHGASRL